MRGLASETSPELEARVLAGRARNEDAVVLSVPAGKALVQTVDILAPIVNDAFTFGRIAAANALSDVYALGGEPWCAMNVACFPQALAEDDPEHILSDILRGGQSALLEAGAVPAGGHTVQDDELKYGLAVTGIIDPAHIAVNSGLRPGQRLLLTKALGTGILPLLPRVLDYARDGLIPAGSHLNRKHWSCSTLVETDVDESLESVVFDAQTSGGLLLAVPPDLLGAARAMLEAGGDLACEVGEVLPPRRDGKALLLR